MSENPGNYYYNLPDNTFPRSGLNIAPFRRMEADKSAAVVAKRYR